MGGLGTAATTLITTRGLFIDDGITSALDFGAGITPWFRLYITAYPPPPASHYVAAAGSRPYAPGEIAQLYQPIDPATGLRVDAKPLEEQPFYVPLDKEAEFLSKNRVVTINLNFAGKHLEKIYTVTEHRATKIIEVINVVNATKKRVNVVASGLKRVTTEAVAKIRNLRLRSKYDK
jgi:hypothetical protein